MARIELSVSLELNTACVPEVRAWLDLDPHQGLSSEIELPLTQSARSVWRGFFHVDETRCEHFAYRVGLCAQLEAEWSLRFRHTEHDCDLLVDSDRLMIAKCWLIGNCNVGRGGQRYTPADGRAGSPNRHLVLLPGGSPKRFGPRAFERVRSRW